MLQFKQNDIQVFLILTLTELVTLSGPNYLFVFTQVTTKEQVAFVALNSDDLSAFPTRYNKFQINPSVLFANKNPGEWHYIIYEQASSTNLDPTGLHALEYGKLDFLRSVDFAYTAYDTPTSFKTYNG